MQILALSSHSIYFLGALTVWAIYCVSQFSSIPTIKVWEVTLLSFISCLPVFLLPRIEDADFLWFVAILGIMVIAYLMIKLSRGRVGTLGTLGYLRLVHIRENTTKIVQDNPDVNDLDILVLSDQQFESLSTPEAPQHHHLESIVNNALTKNISILSLQDYLEGRYGYIDVQEETNINQSVLLSPRFYRFNKRVVDTLLSILLLIVLSPLLIGVIAAIWIFDGRPIFYSQERIGKGGYRFRIMKFRTMKNNVEPATEITRLGKFLRQSHIDELPQLLNVIRGEMALVGPRPEWIQLTSDERAPKNYWLRQAVRPGLTGWAQVSYRPSKNRIMRRRKLGFDIFYIKNRSFFLDGLIYLRTFVRLCFFWKGSLD